MLFDLLAPAERRKDPLLELLRGLRAAALPLGARMRTSCATGPTPCSPSPVQKETPEERRLRHAACLLSGHRLARSIPIIRGEQSLNVIAHSAMAGIDHPGRVFLALTVYFRHAGAGETQRGGAVEPGSSALLEQARAEAGPHPRSRHPMPPTCCRSGSPASSTRRRCPYEKGKLVLTLHPRARRASTASGCGGGSSRWPGCSSWSRTCACAADSRPCEFRRKRLRFAPIGARDEPNGRQRAAHLSRHAHEHRTWPTIPIRCWACREPPRQDDISKAFRKLAKELHPDLNPGDQSAAERFKKVSGAYELLGDADKRARYDRGEIDASGEPRRGYNPCRRRSHFGAAPAGRRPGPADDMGFGDIFSDLFGGAARTAHAGRRAGARPATCAIRWRSSSSKP